MGILGAMMFVRFGLEPLVKSLRTVFKASGAWEKSSEYHFLREVRGTAPAGAAGRVAPVCWPLSRGRLCQS